MNELDKLVKVRAELHLQSIGEFLEWLGDQGIFLARYNESQFITKIHPLNISFEKLLADYAGIDLQKVEKERRNLLKKIRGETKSGTKTRNS